MKTHILRTIVMIAGLVLAAFNPAGRAAEAGAAMAGIEQKIERALYRGDAALLTEAEGELAVALKAEPGRAGLRYLEGFGAYARASFEYATKDKKALEKGLVRADELLAKVKGEPWAAEALALRGYVTGQLIGARGSMSGMTLGPKMKRQTSEAVDEVPGSGRALMFHGVTLLSTPEMFGGDPAEALRLFTRAAAVFEKGEGATVTGWGGALTYYWLARARLKAGDLAGAKEAAEKALEREPEYAVVRYGLMKEIEGKLAGK
ncbi:hypothetical protein CMV30_04635 [Nibricoccus aquaticus]|uniref:Uncharacterized protein n=1 Tax=Nibricoccus aquaticus TaxID=2576891 RepID=A0A290Q4T5_9BACT|nr:hypothetical protein [Nibricoccus aquaticus]ATC63297.1 hypothetical protein CMV30_04635 [Nibricoccus aquaticus]